MTDDAPVMYDSEQRSLPDLLREVDGVVLKRFSAFAKASQSKSVFARNLHLADWFEALGDIVRDEIKRREGTDELKAVDPETHLRARTAVMTDQELEALGMGFASLVAAADAKQDTALPALIQAVYEPVRREYVSRHSDSTTDVRPSI